MSRSKNVDVVPVRSEQRLTPLEVAALRLRGLKGRTARDEYHPDTNLLNVMLEAGTIWAEYYTQKYRSDRATYDESMIARVSKRMAITMTREIQAEYDISVSDLNIGQLYGISHDSATLALGYAIPVPESSGRTSEFRSPVMRRRRIRQYAENEQKK